MGLTKWISSKLIWSLLVMAGFYVVGIALGIVPESVQNIFKWFGDNFLLITILLVSFMGFFILLRLTAPKRSQPT